ncbi:DUF3772 domain-containing protein [Phaeobacter sp. QD34_3]|uniref:DUF3772 domain-containing protein n=2 Tax=unclassified Phaeobacter TaxID=2621772 RepID=UPI00237EF398|nr:MULTISPECIES: DUF3772 domain-containing protein [unclassified Phaeobacter]MDE4131587.1 DUF3772 domain-containing protein [Phaeobacter sp. QD34_3]MDE4135324.1 DUF3772 domain-containing protein [Phaeobacter sp. QD34_24]
MGMARAGSLFRLWLYGLALLIALALPLFAQIPAGYAETIDAWQKTASRAEEVIDTNRASSAALEQLRSELAGYRQGFLTAGSENADRIRTLKGQLEALGPAPTEGEGEAQDIAALRASLTQQLSALQVPRVVAEEAYRRADGLIAEIDKIVRERRTERLLERGASPLNPEHWPGAVSVLVSIGTALWQETVVQIVHDTTRERINDSLPAILALVILSALLLMRGRPWARAAGDYLREFGGMGTGVWSFVVSLLQVILPFVGILLLTKAVGLAGILGLRGTLLGSYVPLWALLILSFRWLGEQLFVPRGRPDLLPVADNRRKQARLMVDLMALVLVLQDALGRLEQIERMSPEAEAVLAFPLILAASLLLVRLLRLTIASREASRSEVEDTVGAGGSKIVALLQKGAYAIAILSPLLASAGYLSAAEGLVYPTIATLAVLATTLVLQRFLGDTYGWLSGQEQAAQESLFTVMVGFGLIVLVLPLLALIWGARVADLTELWSRFLVGFSIGDTRISPTAFLSFAVVFAIGYTVTRIVQGSLRNSLLPKTNIDPGGQNAIVSGLGYVGIFLAAVVAISTAGFDLSSLAIVAGALSVGIGFGLQTIVSNFVSGIILLIERPISKGDWIEVGGLMGYVRDISVRATRIETFDRTDVIVPNSDLISGTVTNYTRGNTVGRVIVPVGVAYGTDPRQVEAILLQVAEAHPMVLLNPEPKVIFQGFGADSLDFEIRAILRDVNWVLSVKSDMNYEIARRFEEAGIEIPFAQRDIWIRNPEALVPAAQEAEDREDSQQPPVHPELSELPERPDLDDVDSAEGETDK